MTDWYWFAEIHADDYEELQALYKWIAEEDPERDPEKGDG